MAHNLNNIIVDRVLRGVFTDKEDNIIFSLNQVQDLSLNQTSESMEVTDAFGVSIMELMRSKALEASATNAIYDFGLLAAQYGTEKKEANAGAKLTVPAMKTFEIAEGETEKVLNPAPKAPITAIYALNGDSTLGQKYEKDTNADATHFAYDDATKKITWPTDLEAGTEMFIMYEYESENAIEIINSANNFAKMGKMTFEILAYDVCDPETKLFGYMILPRFQLSNDFDWSIGGDTQEHAFSGRAHVDYCSKDKKMLQVVIVDED
jgi:hypothetical protein